MTAGWQLVFEGAANPVAQVIAEKTGDILYTVRAPGSGRFQPRVYSPGRSTVKSGRDKPDGPAFTGLETTEQAAAGRQTVTLNPPSRCES